MVRAKLSFYEKLDKERYQNAPRGLPVISFDTLFKKQNYLYMNTIPSARFDTAEFALIR